MVKKKKSTAKLKSKKNKYELQFNEQKEKNKLLLAEFDNFRKRTTKERIAIQKYEGQKVFVSILPILDDIDRLLSIKEIKEKSVIDGINLIKSKFVSSLKEYGVSPYDSLGAEFDPDYHEAIMMKKNKSKKNMVIEEFQKGYMYHDRVLRHAKVIVGE